MFSGSSNVFILSGKRFFGLSWTSVGKKKWLLFESTRLAGIEASEHNSEKASHSETKGADVMLICLIRLNYSSNAAVNCLSVY